MRIKRLLGSSESGFVLPAVLSFIIVFIIFSGALLEIINTNLANVNNNVKSQQAFNIAEAGINYYLWHLSHNGTDYQDGTGAPTTQDPTYGYGPYVHQYIDDNAVNKGTFTIWVKPQGGGSTIVTVRSIGQVKNDNNVRTIVAQIGAASFASYGLVSDSALWFGSNETASGPVHSNQGIRLDGPNTDAATSANATYTPPAGFGGGTNDPGVWCDPSVTSPVNCNTRNKTTWQYPVTSVNFASVSSSLCNMKKTALADNVSTASLATQANACSTALPTTRTSSYLPQICTTGSGSSCSYNRSIGYLIKLNANGTYDLLKVTNENDHFQAAYTNQNVLATTSLATGISIPPSGVIFAEDNVWVATNPTFHGRVSIAAGRLAQSSINAEIVLAGPLAYTNKTEGDAIGLVSEASIFMAPYAPFAVGATASCPAVTWPSSSCFNYEIDGALLAEGNNVTYGENSESSTNTWRFRNNSNSNPLYTYGWTKSNQTLTMYGSVAVRQTWTWNIDYGAGNSTCPTNINTQNLAYDSVSGHCFSGIMNTNNQYDYNLLYSPPPSYPLANGYQILSWREVLSHP